jgi:hypothetical protein
MSVSPRTTDEQHQIVHAALPDEAAPSLRSLYALWESRRRGRRVPARQDIDVLELRPWLGWLTVMDMVDDGADFIYRIFGTSQAAQIGIDLTGRHASTCPAVTQSFLNRLREAGRTARPIFGVRVIEVSARGYAYRWQRLILPLTRQTEAIDTFMILAAPVEPAVSPPPPSAT